GEHTANFALLYRGDLRVKDDMGSAFHQRDTAGLWKGTAREFLLGVIGKDTAIGISIGQVFHGRIGGDQSQTKAKGRARLWRRQRTSQLVKEHAHWGHAQLVAALTEGSG